MSVAKYKKVNIIYLALPLIWAIFMFGFSLQTGEVSSEMSGGIVAWLEETLLVMFGKIEILELLIRKTAHFAEYGVLGVLTMLSVSGFSIKRERIAAMVYCVMVATIDEIIQRFVPGRSGQVTDVLLDSVGALCGVLLFAFVKSIWNKKRKV